LNDIIDKPTPTPHAVAVAEASAIGFGRRRKLQRRRPGRELMKFNFSISPVYRHILMNKDNKWRCMSVHEIVHPTLFEFAIYFLYSL